GLYPLAAAHNRTPFPPIPLTQHSERTGQRCPSRLVVLKRCLGHDQCRMDDEQGGCMAATSHTANGQIPDAGTPLQFTRDEELTAYREMLLIRRFEEKAGQLYGMGFIGGFCHLYIGQEAVVVGMQMAIKPGDQVITTYVDHGHMLATGMDP